MRYARDFLSAMFEHWKTFISGGLLAIIPALIEHHSQRTISWRVYSGFLLTGIFAACFRAWKLERIGKEISEREFRLLELSLASPALEVGGFGVFSAGMRDRAGLESTTVVFGFTILNPNGPATGVTNWHITLKLNRERERVVGEIAPPSTQDLRLALPDKSVIVYQRDQAFLTTPSRIVEQGGSLTGWMMVIFRGLEPNAFDHDDAMIEIAFETIVGRKPYKLEHKFPSSGDSFHVPGIGEINRRPSPK